MRVLVLWGLGCWALGTGAGLEGTDIALQADRASCSPTTHSPFVLSSRLAQARSGDWALLQIGDQAVLWRVTRESSAILLEEWAVPQQLIDTWGTHQAHWTSWMDQDGPGAEGRSLYRWRQPGGWEHWERASVSWQPLPEHGALLNALFGVPLAQVPPCHQRRCGPRPRPGLADDRPIWRPAAAQGLRDVEVWSASVSTPEDEPRSIRLTVWLAPLHEPAISPAFPLHAEAEHLGVKLRCRLLSCGRIAASELSTVGHSPSDS